MRYRIAHITTYTYSEAVKPHPHILRLRPRADGTQQLHDFALTVTPEPLGRSELVDLDGNATQKVWFASKGDRLEFKTVSDVETLRENPFDYLLDPIATTLPIDYSASLQAQLQPYFATPIDPVAVELAQDIWHAVGGNTVAFLGELNQRIYDSCQYYIRDEGDPLPAGLTWRQKAGSCRDYAVLFQAVCRAMNLAARFVSGYQEGDPDSQERHLHAWVEVYLPGAGWRGYDPTLGLAVGDGHITLAASAFPRAAAPVSGSFDGSNIRVELSYALTIEKR